MAAQSAEISRGYADGEGFRYHYKSSFVNTAGIKTKYYACINDTEKLSCPGTLNLYVFKDGEEKGVPKKKHNLACEEKLKADKIALKKEVKEIKTQFFHLVQQDPGKKKTKSTFDQVIAKADLKVAQKLSYREVSRHGRRLKAKARKETVIVPALLGTKTIQDLGAELEEAQRLKKPISFKIGADVFQVTSVILNGDEKQGYTILWYIESHAKQFKQAKLSMDGTFKFCPKLDNRSKHQFFTVMADRRGCPLPLAFSLMTSKKGEAYELIFRTLDTKFPELKPVEILGDFEQAPRNAAVIVWPGVKIIGCFFHSSQAIEKHSKSDGLIRRRVQKSNEDPRRYALKRKAQTLALLRPQDMDEGFGIVYKEGLDLNDDKVIPFLDYVDKQWIHRKEEFSVYGELRRTNNALESSHSALNENGKAPPVSTVVEIIANRFRDAILKHAYLDNLAEDLERKGQEAVDVYELVCEKSSAQRKYDIALQKAWDKLATGKWSVALFLDKMSSVTSKKFPMSVQDFLKVDAQEADLLQKETALNSNDGHDATDEVSETEAPSPPKEKKRAKKRSSQVLNDITNELSQKEQSLGKATSGTKRAKKTKESAKEDVCENAVQYQVTYLKRNGLKVKLSKLR